MYQQQTSAPCCKISDGSRAHAPPNACDDLIEDQEDVVARADLAQYAQVLGGRVDEAARVADGLDQHCA